MSKLIKGKITYTKYWSRFEQLIHASDSCEYVEENDKLHCQVYEFIVLRLHTYNTHLIVQIPPSLNLYYFIVAVIDGNCLLDILWMMSMWLTKKFSKLNYIVIAKFSKKNAKKLTSKIPSQTNFHS